MLIGDSKITDGAIPKLGTLTQLKVLWLNESKIGDESLKTVAGFPFLENLSLTNSSVSDRGLEILATSKLIDRLGALRLNHCSHLSDKGMESLAKIGSLTELLINGNPQLTEAAVRKLQAALPKCRIVSDFGTFEPNQN